MSSIPNQSQTTQGAHPPVKPTEMKAVELAVEHKKEGGQQVDFLFIVWQAFYSTVQIGQESSQTQANMLFSTQTAECATNQILAAYQFATVAPTQMGSSWNPAFAVISETNDRVQALISITQNTAAIEQQTGQVQQTNANTAIQNTTQAIQQGYGIAKEMMAITQQISTT